MLRIACPVCGLRDETEFTYGSDATVKRPAADESSLQAWLDYVFFRDNPRGSHSEYWHHTTGCRSWLRVERDTLTNRFGQVTLAKDESAS